jgi:hypothetical protein
VTLLRIVPIGGMDLVDLPQRSQVTRRNHDGNAASGSFSALAGVGVLTATYKLVLGVHCRLRRLQRGRMKKLS